MEDLLLDITASEMRQVSRFGRESREKTNIMARLLEAGNSDRDHVYFNGLDIDPHVEWLYDLGYEVVETPSAVRVSW
jgi:hypothetical protein